jgi:predicted Zn-dependent peptidase
MGMRYLEEAGATERNGSTGQDASRFFETVPAGELELALWIESDRMGFLLENLTERSFANQRAVVDAELRRSYESVPYGWTWRFLDESLYPEGHPYRRLTIGRSGDLAAARLDEASAFFRTWYVPDNAVLVIAGDFEAGRALALVDKYFGPIPARSLPARPAIPPVAPLDHETVVDVAANVETPKVVIAWPTPASFTGDDANLQIAARVLGAGAGSLLFRRLVRGAEIAEKVSVTQSSHPLSSVFSVEILARRGHSLDEVVAAVDDVIAAFQRAGPADVDLERAKSYELARFVFDAENRIERAHALARYRLFTGSADFLDRDMARFEGATRESVRQAAAVWLPRGGRVVEGIAPSKTAPVAGELQTVVTRGIVR